MCICTQRYIYIVMPKALRYDKRIEIEFDQ